MSETTDWREVARRLWKLLDDIDTLDDAFREDDAGFRKAAYAKQRRRFEFMTGEQYDAAGAALIPQPPESN
jgi:hypothetical protein